MDLVLEVIQDLVSCEGVSIFLVSRAGDRLEPVATTGIDWGDTPTDERYYRKGEGLTGKVWETKVAMLTVDARNEPDRIGKGVETVASREEDRCLIMPLREASGEVVGVVRCQNRSKRDRMFTDDDVALIDAVGNVTVPHLRILRYNQKYTESVARVVHELGSPVAAIRGVVESMKEGFHSRAVDDKEFFGEDYLGDIESWADLMKGILVNPNFVGKGRQSPRPNLTRTFLLNGVIAAAVRQVRWLLYDHEFSHRKIEYSDFAEIPKLWIDRNQFQQVFFNLLNNSIKYSFKDHSAFQVQIGGTNNGYEFLIWCRDWGIGIDSGMEHRIFEEGVRGPNSVNYIAGQGIGLSVVRKIIRAHHGKIEVTKLRNPTEFTISLPLWVASTRPS